MSEKRPSYRDSNVVSLMSLPVVRNWFDGNGNKLLGMDRCVTLLGDNRAEFQQIYGKRQQTYTTDYRFDVWYVVHENVGIWVLSAKSKGTSFEIEPQLDRNIEDENKLVRFLEMLYKELNELTGGILDK